MASGKAHHPSVAFRLPQEMLDRLDDLTVKKRYQFRSDLLLDLITTHPALMVTIQEAEASWNVSERTIRRGLAKGVSGATRAGNGQWFIPTSWLDDEYGGASSTITVQKRTFWRRSNV